MTSRRPNPFASFTTAVLVSVTALTTSALTHAQDVPTSAALTQWDIFTATGGGADASQNVASVFMDVSGIAGPAGSVWITTQSPKPRLGRLSPSLTVDNYVEWRPILFPEPGGAPLGLALNRSNGDLWVAVQGDPPLVMKVGNSDTFRKYRSTQPLSAQSITVDVEGAAIAALPTRNAEGLGDAIVRVPRASGPGSVTMTVWLVGGEPRFVALDGSGNIWYTARLANKVGRLNPSTGAVTEWVMPAGTHPTGLHVSGSSVCVVSSGMTGALTGMAHCLDSDTSQFTQYARAGDGLDVPQRVAFNTDGEMFITEQRGDAVSFVSYVARAAAPVLTVAPITRTVLPVTSTLSVTEGTYASTAYTVPAIETALAGDANGDGHVRFTLPRPTLPYPFAQTGYPQPLGITPVFDDLGRGTGTVFLGEYFNGSIAGRQAGARLSRFVLGAAATTKAVITNPTSLRFDAIEGAAAPGTQAVAITEAGGLPLAWTATKTASWLALTPSGGSAPASMTVAVNHEGLAPGTYVDTIAVDDGAGGAEARSVAVELNVTAPATLELSDSSLTFSVVAKGAFPPAQAVTVMNGGAGTLDWTLSASDPWLLVSQTSGVAPCSIDITIDPSTLTQGTRNGTVTVTSPSALNSPQTIAVTVYVSNTGPQIAVGPTSMTFTATAGAAPPPAETLTIANSGGGTVSWSATTSASWLSVWPASGAAQGIPGGDSQVSVTVDPLGLTRGTHTATVTVSDPGASDSPRTVPVSFVVSAPTISASASSLAFITPAGGTPSVQTITISNTGDAPLTFTPSTTTSSGGPWLSANPSGSTTVAPGGSVTLNVAVSSAAITAGSYAGSLTITDPAATNNPVSVSVTLSVVNGPFIEISPASLSFSTLRGRNPADQTLTVRNSGNAPLNLSAAPSGGSWLSVTPAAATLAPGATATLTVIVTSSTFSTGSYGGSIDISDASASNSPQASAVSLTVVPAPTITLLPTILTFTGARWTTCNGVESGQTVASQPLTLGNSGDAPLDYTAAVSGGSWLSVLPTWGSVAAGATQPLTVEVDLRGLGRGTYTGMVTVSDPDATNLTQSADVTLTVGNAAATLCVTPTTMDFGTVARNSTTSTQILELLNVGDEPMGGWNATWTASRGTVNLSSSNGASPTSISVSVSSNTQRGDQTGTITIAAAGAGNSPVTVNLTWTVQ